MRVAEVVYSWTQGEQRLELGMGERFERAVLENQPKLLEQWLSRPGRWWRRMERKRAGREVLWMIRRPIGRKRVADSSQEPGEKGWTGGGERCPALRLE